MKVVLASLMAGTALAGFEGMKRDFESMVNRYVRGLVESGQQMDRRIADLMTPENFEKINEYACWCYFEDDHGRGHGKPVNGVDYLCKKLADGYDCCMLDVVTLTGNDTCVPWNVFFLPGTGTGETNLVANCDGFNPVQAVTNNGFCENCACKVEGLFTLRVFNLFFAGGVIDPQFSHDPAQTAPEPAFDETKDGACVLHDGIQDTERLCCGEAPHRFPYKPLSGERGCCGEATFDTTLQECCPDNVARLSC
jgi:hypothetical protein